MTNVICPNCRLITPIETLCPNCKFPILAALEGRVETEPVPQEELATGSSDLQQVEAGGLIGMDPQLQRLSAKVAQGVLKLPTCSTGENEVAVIAEVTDVAEFEALVKNSYRGRIGVKIPPNAQHEGEEQTTIVTARIKLAATPAIKLQRGVVKSLKASRRLGVCLDKALREVEARKQDFPGGHRAQGGKGVVIGIVDLGLDFRRKEFLNEDNSSRILEMWDQTHIPDQQHPGELGPCGYGRIISKELIDEALNSEDALKKLGYNPFPEAHATSVAHIAAGNGRGSNLPGVAPDADIVFVELATTDIATSSRNALDASFGDSAQLLEAIWYIFQVAGERPCVINVSLGTCGGPHDGTTLVERAIDRLIDQAPSRAVVLAAGNFFEPDGVHAQGQVSADQPFDLVWDIQRNDLTGSELELWYSREDQLALTILQEDGKVLAESEPGAPVNKPGIFVVHRLNDPGNGDNLINIFLENTIAPGKLTLRLQPMRLKHGRFDAWIERDRATLSLLVPSDKRRTISSIACGKNTIAVGAYDTHEPDPSVFQSLYFASSSGPTRSGIKKPELSAPGRAVVAASPSSFQGLTPLSGTSIAAPVVTGTIALMLAEANQRGRSLKADVIRDILIKTARKNPPDRGDWDERYGYGRVSTSRAVAAVVDLFP